MSELIIGNIIGSNIYNLLLILGFISFFEAFSFPKEVLFFEVIFLFVCAVGFSLILYFKKELNKNFSWAFITLYFFYLLKLLLTNF
jgi:cation:H+ antiporter